jgi:hypothetical protein
MPKVRFYIDLQNNVPVEQQPAYMTATTVPLGDCSTGFTRYTFTVDLPGPMAVQLPDSAVSAVRKADEEE